MRVGPGVTEPIELTRVKPQLVQNKSLSTGVIILEGIITVDGKVERVRVLRPVSPEADEAAVEAVRQWRYRPATYQGRPVPVYLTVTVNLCPM
jgi:TonB family protein